MYVCSECALNTLGVSTLASRVAQFDERREARSLTARQVQGEMTGRTLKLDPRQRASTLRTRRGGETQERSKFTINVTREGVYMKMSAVEERERLNVRLYCCVFSLEHIALER